MKRILIILLALIVGFGGIFGLSRTLESLKPLPNETAVDDDLYFAPNELAAAGHDFRGLIADWYWINSLQYLGGKILANQEKVDINDLKPLNPKLLYPMLDTATTLDPQFLTIYSYGATVLPAIDNNLAIRLLDKGITANPNQWRLYHNLGYIYWQTKDYQKAAETYAEGATKEGAPVWMKQMSVNMQAQGGDREFALQIYRQMRDSAEDEQTKSFADLRYKQVVAAMQMEIINQVLPAFKQKSGRCANSWNEILSQLNELSRSKNVDFQIDNFRNVVDPTGIAFILDKNSCTASVNPDSKIPKF